MLETSAVRGLEASAKGAPARAVFEVLRAWGIDHVFTCPGSTEAAFLDASAQYPDVRLVLVTHESIAIAAADGYTRATGRPAVAYLHTNVGLANCVAHLDCVQLARSPVVILNGMKSTHVQNRGGFTTASHQRDYVRQHVVYERIALRPEQVAEDLVRALNAATSEPGGPVYLGLPQDIMESAVPVPMPDVKRRIVRARRRPDPESVADAARSLTESRRLIIVAGTEVARNDARAELMSLAERLDATVLLEERRTMQWNGVPPNGTRFAGFYNAQHPAVREADVIFFAGTPSTMEYDAAKEPNVPLEATVIHLCSDPGEIAKVDPADVALAGNVKLALADVMQALSGKVPGGAERAAFRLRSVSAYRESSHARRTKAKAQAQRVPIDVQALADALHGLLEDDAIVVGQPTTAGSDMLNIAFTESNRTYHKSSGGSLGWGMGAAVGVALGARKRIYCLVGDGVFQFGIQALWSAVALALPITFILNDNSSYAAVKGALKRYRDGDESGPWPGTDTSGPDYAAIARGFGAHAARVERLGDLRAALEDARKENGPAVIVVRTDPTVAGHSA
jgi:benzoylformate decarboxylase